MPLDPLYIKSGLRSPAAASAALDDQFFRDHPDRNYRIRSPQDGEPPEYDREFISLGDHDVSRRRIIVKRVEPSKARQFGVKYMPIPFLLFADETIEDDDKVLRPIFDGIMKEAANSYGVG